jgi:hypothetical protein
MNKHEEEDNLKNEKTIIFVYLPDEQIYGTIIGQGAWTSLIEYHEDGIGYKVEMPNDEFIVLDEIGIGYLEEMEEDI